MESHNNLLDTLTEEQQLEVYNLMGITNLEDVNAAARLYIDANYDTSRAVQRFFDGQTAGATHREHEEHEFTQADEHDVLTGNQRNRGEDDPHTQYRKFLERKRAEEAQKGIVDTVKWGVGGVFYVVKSVLRYVVPTFIRGETAGGEQFIHFWRREFGDLPPINFSTGGFEENATYAESYRRPLLVYLHNNQEDPSIPRRVFAQNLVDYINNKFHVLGLLSGTEEAQKANRLVEPRANTYLAVFRVNLLEEVCLVEAIPLNNQTSTQSVLEHLRNCQSNYSIIHGEEDRIKQDVERSLDEQRRRNMQMNVPSYITYDQFVQNPRRNAGNAQQNNPNREEQQRRLEEARLLRQVQDEEFKEVERKIQQQQKEKAETERIAKEKFEREEKTRREQEEEARRKQENKELTKKLKLAAVPAEPAENDPSAVLIIFRLPDGNRIGRRFKSSDAAQALYDYVDTKDVQFDPSTKNYDLMQPRPFLCLDDKNKTIGDYFEGSNSEVVTIRELTE